MARAHHSMARIDDSKRSSGLPSRRLRPAWAASAVALRRVASREAPRLPERPPLGCSVDNSRARRRMLLRAARRLCRRFTPRTFAPKIACDGLGLQSLLRPATDTGERPGASFSLQTTLAAATPSPLPPHHPLPTCTHHTICRHVDRRAHGFDPIHDGRTGGGPPAPGPERDAHEAHALRHRHVFGDCPFSAVLVPPRELRRRRLESSTGGWRSGRPETAVSHEVGGW